MFEFVRFEDLHNYAIGSEDEMIERLDNPETEEEED